MLPLDRSTHQRVASALDAAVQERAARAFEQFEAMPHPTEKDEDWRYVELDFDLADYAIADAPGTALGSHEIERLLGPLAGKAVNIDGHTISVDGGDGVEVKAGLGAVSPTGTVLSDRFAALHDAFARDGVIVSTKAGAQPEAPVLIDLQTVTDGGLALPRISVVAGEQSSVSVVVLQRSPDGIASLVVPAFEVSAGAAARVEVTVIQEWGDDTVSIAAHRMASGRDASLYLAEAGYGGRYSRLRLAVDLVGAGAGAKIVGVYFGDGEQTLDYRYYMRHAARSTTSEMFLKGAVADHAKSVFSGLIRIEKEGQKTNAHQTNRNLVLSDGAEAHSVPNLEILADDVRCGHGSAVGPLDEEQRYYLQSRGLDRPRADRLQVKGFFEEAIQRFPYRALDSHLRDIALDKYAAVAL
ncbi:MAG: Fe-S cluster assembly protein SufD [Acidimicrobiia bacterium]